MWLQSFDDVYCDERPGGTPLDELVVLLAKLTRIMDDPGAALLPDNPWAESLRDLRLSVAEHASPVQAERWVTAMNAFFEGLLWETVQRTSEAPQEVDDYVSMWLKQSGVHPCTVFTDIVCGYEVPAHEWALPRVQALRDMVAAIIGWDNDLTSFDKEVHRARDRGLPAVQNLAAVLTQDGSHSVGEVVKVTVTMRNNAVALFLRLRDEMAADGSPELGRYVHGLGQWIRGYLDYSRLSPRVHRPAQPRRRRHHRRPHGWLDGHRPPFRRRRTTARAPVHLLLVVPPMTTHPLAAPAPVDSPRPRPVPVAPGRLPVLGHAVPLFREPLGFLRSLARVGPGGPARPRAAAGGGVRLNNAQLSGQLRP
jgi:hypothetical protein